ncbi:QWRF motif-containing protein 2-like, partial [Trifolium medium]|nr:QWRF motif-containing protein 2-like [Trifolium medium]
GDAELIVVPARFWQEATNPLRRQVDQPSPRNGGFGNKSMVPPKLLVQKKLMLDSPAMSPRGINCKVRPASP